VAVTRLFPDEIEKERDDQDPVLRFVRAIWRFIADNFNKGLRLIASVGLTSMAALNTYDFLSAYNDWRVSAAASISFEVMYVAAAWRLRLPYNWRWLSNDATVIIIGVVCSAVYNVLAHVNREVLGAFDPWQWKIALSFIMSLLLTIPALLLLLSIHGNNDEHVTQSNLSEDRILNLFDEFGGVKSELETNNEKLTDVREALELIRSHLKI